MYRGRRGLRVGSLLVAVAALPLVGCSGDDKPSSLSEQLAHYTDSGDGCQQVVSAISYADTSLKPAGQERYVTWTDEVRSKISAVSGTISLEVKDFPAKQALDQARRTARLPTARPPPGCRRRSGSGCCRSTAARRPRWSSSARG